jgi:hypothetical protein
MKVLLEMSLSAGCLLFWSVALVLGAVLKLVAVLLAPRHEARVMTFRHIAP